eukprot:9138958-Alexandrium_andersonii.AAC.1
MEVGVGDRPSLGLDAERAGRWSRIGGDGAEGGGECSAQPDVAGALASRARSLSALRLAAA